MTHVPEHLDDVVFIVGCARSGTSIVGELVAQHAEVCYVFEAHTVWAGAGLGANGSHRLTADAASYEVARQVRRELTERFTSGSQLVEKNPRGSLRIPFLNAVFSRARFVHVVRDGRDVACSLLPGCGGSEWRHMKPPSWRELQANYTGLARTARVWRDVLEVALADLEGVSHLTVRFEDFVGDPNREAGRILGFLGLEATADVERFYELIRNRVAGSYEAATQVKWSRPDHDVRIGRWRQNIPVDQQDAVSSLLAPMLRRLQYEL